MARNLEAERLNQRYQEELQKLIRMQEAADQQQDIVVDLHLKYVQAITKKK